MTATCDTLCDPAAKVRFDRHPLPQAHPVHGGVRREEGGGGQGVCGAEQARGRGLHLLRGEERRDGRDPHRRAGGHAAGNSRQEGQGALRRGRQSSTEPKIAYRETIRSTSQRRRANTRNRRAATGSTATVRSASNRAKNPSCSKKRWSAARCPSSTSPRWKRALRGKPVLRPHRGLSRHGREGGAVRRQLSRSGQLGNGVQSGGGARVQRGAEKRLPRPARTRVSA